MTDLSRVSYEVVEGWEQLPAGYAHLDVCGTAVDSKDRLFVLTRSQEHVIVYEPDGSFVTSWGEDILTSRPHGLTIAPDDSVFLVVDRGHLVHKFTPEGERLFTIGTGVPSDTGYRDVLPNTIVRGGPPFNEPTNLAIAPNGELYISDGYGNARVHRFTAEGELIQSWGEPGSGPGQFNLPHGICVIDDGRVFVADRENDRLQIFGPAGEFLEEWTQVQRPTNVQQGPDGLLYVSELWWPVGPKSFTEGEITENQPARVSILDRNGAVLKRIAGTGDPCAPGNFCAPHDVAVDSRGDIYVGEVAYSFAGRLGVVPTDCHTLQKFVRKEIS